MAFLIPMGGMSARFRSEGFTLPKYMLYAKNKSLFNLSVSTFSNYFDEKFIFICKDIFDTRKFIKEELSILGIKNYEIIVLDLQTNGQAETIKLGIENSVLDNDDEIFIFNIDTKRENYTKPHFLKDCHGYLEVFEGEGTNWSFIEPLQNDSNQVKRTTEKDPISNLCSNGLYYFRNKDFFLETYNSFYEKDHNMGEEYIAPMYNYLIAKEYIVKYDKIDGKLLKVFGVPNEYYDLVKSYLNE
jgi:NDP-sugar pyrophosphorylase family protein